jgi:hypothetical protein
MVLYDIKHITDITLSFQDLGKIYHYNLRLTLMMGRFHTMFLPLLTAGNNFYVLLNFVKHKQPWAVRVILPFPL